MHATNRDADDDAHYTEYSEIHLETVCIEPEKISGRPVHFLLSSRRNYLAPPRIRGMPNDKPTSVGLLHIRKDGGGYYGGVPHESISIMMTCLAANHFRYVMLSGPPLSYGESWCTDLHLMKSAD